MISDAQTGLRVYSRFFKPQRLGVVDGGFGADVISALVVLLDRIAPEPVLDTGIIVAEPPEGLGYRTGMWPQAENLGDGLRSIRDAEIISKTRSKRLVQKRDELNTIRGRIYPLMITRLKQRYLNLIFFENCRRI